MTEINDEIKKAQKEKLNAEIARLKSETAKINIEKKKLEKESKTPWYKKDKYLQAFFAGVVAVPLLWFFFNEIAIPIYQKENVKLSYENEVAKVNLEKQKDSLIFLKESIKLKDSIARMEREKAWDDYEFKIKELQMQRDTLINQYQNLITQIQNKEQSTQQDYQKEITDLKEKYSLLTQEPKEYVSTLTINDNFILEGEGVEYWETPKNQTKFGKGNPDAIVFHYTAGMDLESSARQLQGDKFRASNHVMIGRDGRIIQLVPFNIQAWHSGKSSYGGRDNYNQYAIGITFDNAGILSKDGKELRAWFGKIYDMENAVKLIPKNESTPNYWHTYTEAQIRRAKEVCQVLTNTFQIREILGNDDIAPDRKRDPGPAFPMKDFQKKFLSE